MYTITEDKNILKIVTSKKYARLVGLILIVFCLFLGHWTTSYQLRCESKTSSYAGQCSLIANVVYFVPVNTPLGRVMEVNIAPSLSGGKPNSYYQLSMLLDSERHYSLPIFFVAQENASIAAAYINQYISDDVRPIFNIVNPEKTISKQLLTILLFLFGVSLLFMRNGTISFDKSANVLLIQNASIIPSIKKYPLSDVSRALVQEKMLHLALEKSYLLVLELKDNEYLFLSDTRSEDESELINLSEKVNKFLPIA